MPNEHPDYAKWFNRSLKLLTFRPRTVKEISDYLIKKKVPQDLITQIIDQLVSRKLLDDRAFADWFIENRITFRPRSARILSQELLQKGIARDVIADALQTQLTEDQELAGAIKMAQKKLRHLKNLPEKERNLKMKSFLWQKGYNSKIIEQTLQSLQVR